MRNVPAVIALAVLVNVVPGRAAAVGGPLRDYRKYIYLDQLAVVARGLREVGKDAADPFALDQARQVASQRRYGGAAADRRFLSREVRGCDAFEKLRKGTLQPGVDKAASLDAAKARAALAQWGQAALVAISGCAAQLAPATQLEDDASADSDDALAEPPKGTKRRLRGLAQLAARTYLALLAVREARVGKLANPWDPTLHPDWQRNLAEAPLAREIDFLESLSFWTYGAQPVMQEQGQAAAISSLQLLRPGPAGPFGYATSYALDEVFADTPPPESKGVRPSGGMVAFLFVPALPAESSRAAILVFRGTSVDQMVPGTGLVAGGVAADLDPKGIGRAAFGRFRDRFSKLMTGKLRGRLLTITGQSLGGTYAQRFFAALPQAEDVRRVRLVTFEAPGIDAASINEGLKSGVLAPFSTRHVLHVRTENDPVWRGGGVHVRGLVQMRGQLVKRPSWKNHIAPVGPDRAYALSGYDFFVSDQTQLAVLRSLREWTGWWERADAGNFEELARKIATIRPIEEKIESLVK